MRINADTIAQNQTELKKLNEQQKRHIQQRDAEVKNIEKLSDAQINEKKVEAEKKLHELQDRNQQQLLEAVDGKAEKIEKYKTEIIKAQEHLDKERTNLEKQHHVKMEDLNKLNSDKFQRKYDEAEINSKLINDKVNTAMKDLESSTEQTLIQSRHDNAMDLKLAAMSHEAKINNKNNTYRKMQHEKDLEHARALQQNELEHSRNVQHLLRQNLIETEQRKKSQHQVAQAEADHFKNILTSKRVSFQKKFDQMQKEHDEVTRLAKERFASELASLSKAHAKDKEMLLQKSSDSFYEVERLKPTLQDEVDHYLVSIPVAPHEKENVHLSAHKRTIKMSFTRRADERIEDSNDLSIYTTKRSEAFTKEFPTKDIVDSGKITRKYDNGLLTYKIMKA